MTTIYDSYDDEPEDVFLPLDDQTYARFYHQEMKDFDGDLSFYTKELTSSTTILELGCGGARLSRQLIDLGYNLTGIDLSDKMLEIAQTVAPQGTFVAANICHFNLQAQFDAILAPYNVLNLLQSKEDIGNCLATCHNHIKDKGLLLIEVYSHDGSIAEGEKSFQFQVLPHPDTGRLVKEIVRTYGKESIQVEERYRSRPTGEEFTDYSHTFSINAFSKTFWKDILSKYGFKTLSCVHQYPSEPLQDTTHGKTLITAMACK